jgi:transcription elongation factor GreA
MGSNLSYVTEEGLRKMKDELEQLEKVDRPALSKQIAEARDKGDLSENAEYDAAKEAQGLLEVKISRLKETIALSKVIDNSNKDISKVRLLNTIKIKNKKTNAVMSYMLVPENEANLKSGKISVDSPIAKSLLGKSVGETVDVQVPSGIIPFEVLEIS